MLAGKLKAKLIIEKATVTKGAMGGKAVAWSQFAVVRGALEFGNSKAVIAAQQINSAISGVLRIRYIPGITAKMRINNNNEYYNIERPVNVGGRNRELIIPFTVGVNDG